jgi:hypothetical protein
MKSILLNNIKVLTGSCFRTSSFSCRYLISRGIKFIVNLDFFTFELDFLIVVYDLVCCFRQVFLINKKAFYSSDSESVVHKLVGLLDFHEPAILTGRTGDNK